MREHILRKVDESGYPPSLILVQGRFHCHESN